jgi:hypothetical protein
MCFEYRPNSFNFQFRFLQLRKKLKGGFYNIIYVLKHWNNNKFPKNFWKFALSRMYIYIYCLHEMKYDFCFVKYSSMRMCVLKIAIWQKQYVDKTLGCSVKHLLKQTALKEH